MECKFNPNKCDINCKKYLLCSYYSIQNQFIELQSQMNFLYKTMSDILKQNEDSDIKINLLEKAFYKYINDSETRETIKES
jgi:hypothetical protein